MDVDNCFKSLLDALQHAHVYRNDSQISRLAVDRCNPVKGGACVVYVRELPRGYKIPHEALGQVPKVSYRFVDYAEDLLPGKHSRRSISTRRSPRKKRKRIRKTIRRLGWAIAQ